MKNNKMWTQKQHIMIPSPPIPSLRCPPIGAMSGHVLTLLAVGDVTAPYTCRMWSKRGGGDDGIDLNQIPGNKPLFIGKYVYVYK